MRILSLVDKKGSAIDRLQEAIAKYNPHLEIKVLPLHPKRPDGHEIAEAVKAVQWCTHIHVGYWRSLEKLRQFTKFDGKTLILSHHNPYDLIIDRKHVTSLGFGDGMKFTETDHVAWDQMYDDVIVANSDMQLTIPYAHKIPQGIDLNFWEYAEVENARENTVLMVAGRIEGKKGIKEVAQVTHELGYKFLLVGRVSSGEYFNEIKSVCPNLEFRENVSEEDLQKAYHDAVVLAVNSVDGFESGPTVILEAMASGTCVLTRNVGHVVDLYDGQNMVVRYGASEDVEDLKKELKGLMENVPLRKRLREKGWDTVKNLGADRMAARFEKIYYNSMVREHNTPFVSVITPTYNRPEVLIKNLVATLNSDYPAFEVVIPDSSDVSIKPVVDGVVKQFKIKNPGKSPIVKYIYFERNGQYSLPKARNLGLLHSSGDVIVLCDERLAMEPTAISHFVSRLAPQSWLWGIKDEFQKGFVENFSCIYRMDLVRFGGFNEAIDCYGGATQELRTRFEEVNRIQLTLAPKAKAHSITRSGGKHNRRDAIIQAKFKVWKYYGE